MKKIEQTKDKLAGLHAQIVGAAKEADAHIKNLDAEIQSRLDERQRLESEPLTKADFLDHFRAKVKRVGEAHAFGLSRKLLAVDRSLSYAKRKDAGFDFLQAGLGVGNVTITQVALCYFFEDAIVAGVEKALPASGWGNDGTLTAAALMQRILTLDAEIDALEIERSSYIDVLKSYQIVS